jgi:hypothetical protein
MFYFLWHGQHIQGGPFDVSKILAADPAAMQKPDSPLWGPLHAPHHWGESIFGYYLTSDEAVLRKHAQMLADAGVDVVIFDVTNQFTYRDDYMTLLRVWARERELGNRTPQVAFLTPFWAPAKVVRELWKDLYEPGHFRELWFQWEGRPLILADPALISDSQGHAQQNTPAELRPGHTLGQSFTTTHDLTAVSARVPTWRESGSAVTLTLRRESPQGQQIASKRFENVADNAWLRLDLEKPAGPGSFYFEASEGNGASAGGATLRINCRTAAPSQTAWPSQVTEPSASPWPAMKTLASGSFSRSASRSRITFKAPLNLACGAGWSRTRSTASPILRAPASRCRWAWLKMQ